MSAPNELTAVLVSILAPGADPEPGAWLGMAEGFEKPTVRICCRCPDRRQAEARAVAMRFEVTHAECPICHAAVMAQIRKELWTSRAPTNGKTLKPE